MSEPGSAPDKVKALAPGERARLAAILARLASPFEGERAAAGLLASAFVEKHGLSWSDVTSLLEPAPAKANPVASVVDPKPVAPVIASEPAGSSALEQDRRRGSGRAWRGFNRRRRAVSGQALDRLS